MKVYVVKQKYTQEIRYYDNVKDCIEEMYEILGTKEINFEPVKKEVVKRINPLLMMYEDTVHVSSENIIPVNAYDIIIEYKVKE